MHKEDHSAHQNEIKSLILQARDGNDVAFSKLLELYEPLILAMLAKYAFDYDENGDRDDALQDLRVAFYRAVNGYDPEQNGVDFGLFAKICLKNALISRTRAKKAQGFEILPIEDAADICSPEQPGDKIVEIESLQALLTLINENLSDYEKNVWNLYLEGKKPRLIAEHLGKDVKSISNALARIRAKLRSLIGESNT